MKPFVFLDYSKKKKNNIGEELKKRACHLRSSFLRLLLVFLATGGGGGVDASSCNAIMLTALSHTAGAVIKKGFLLLLCLPDFLNLQPP